ncbi:DUF6931 family protein [Pseudosulfitobacter koreensis]|uniref:Secreted protein n=1 Tax=Pseudosulfitobacter koreensis TaxID=2968472 RepID=A0ABT1Z2K3_9RHOB|nr:hypothetical protein [Pseudosulfitobacter koreense]MCR8827362.1 hypothetical protein [Pseudosulfitobacter koreense]
MTERFSDLKKVPREPAMRLLAAKRIKLATPLKAPANAPVETVLEELGAQQAWVCILRMLSAALPEREAVWWACLAARDICGDGPLTPSLKAAEAWVFEPNDANREKVQIAIDTADADDDTVLAATAALYAPGSLGIGDLAQMAAPPGAVAACAFGMNMTTLGSAADPMLQMQLIIDRAVSVARGGNGKVDKITEPPAPEPIAVEGDL